MKDIESPHFVDLSDHEPQEWLVHIREHAQKTGSWHPLGDQHFAALTGHGSTLLVTFETLQDIQENRELGQPLGFDMAQVLSCSNLMILSDGATWFRDEALFGFFDGLIDEGVFEEFDQVVFYGARMCGYAAAAFSVSAPGCKVVLVHPQATLDPSVTEWDHRFQSMRRVSFTDRYGYAPEMIEAVDQAFVLYDPEEELDAMHAALFTKSNVTKLRCRYMGGNLHNNLSDMGLLPAILEQAAEGALTALSFAKLYRARRDYPLYLRSLLRHLEDDDRTQMMAWLCVNGLKRKNMPRLRKRLEQLTKDGVPGADQTAN